MSLFLCMSTISGAVHYPCAAAPFCLSEHGRTVSARSVRGSCDLCQNMLRLLQNGGAEKANSKKYWGREKSRPQNYYKPIILSV